MQAFHDEGETVPSSSDVRQLWLNSVLPHAIRWRKQRLSRSPFREIAARHIGYRDVREIRSRLPAEPVLEHFVTPSKDLIQAALASIEEQEPLFFGDLPLSDEAARGVFVAAMAALRDSPEFRRATPQRRELSLLGILAHALLDAALLREQLQRDERRAATAADHVIAKAAAA